MPAFPGRVVANSVSLPRFNRIIGDLKFPDGFPEGPRPKQFQTKLFTLGKRNRDLESLQPSVLLGPVRVFVEQDYFLSFSRR